MYFSYISCHCSDYNNRSLSLLDEDSIVFWCGYFNPGNIIAAHVMGVVRIVHSFFLDQNRYAFMIL